MHLQTSRAITSRFCYCGHLTSRHVFEEKDVPFDSDLPDAQPQFIRCDGIKPVKGKSEVCGCSGLEPFPLGVYIHAKGNLYLVYGLEFDSEGPRGPRGIRVQYTLIDQDPTKTREPVRHGEKWTRPLHGMANGEMFGFMDPTSDGRPRFRLVTHMHAVDLVNNVVLVQPNFETDLAPHDMLTLHGYAETSESDGLRLEIRELTKKVEHWKKRAEQHGCDIENGDDDCG